MISGTVLRHHLEQFPGHTVQSSDMNPYKAYFDAYPYTNVACASLERKKGMQNAVPITAYTVPVQVACDLALLCAA